MRIAENPLGAAAALAALAAPLALLFAPGGAVADAEAAVRCANSGAQHGEATRRELRQATRCLVNRKRRLHARVPVQNAA